MHTKLSQSNKRFKLEYAMAQSKQDIPDLLYLG
jgi:hypothetical protein